MGCYHGRAIGNCPVCEFVENFCSDNTDPLAIKLTELITAHDEMEKLLDYVDEFAFQGEKEIFWVERDGGGWRIQGHVWTPLGTQRDTLPGCTGMARDQAIAEAKRRAGIE